MAAVVVAFDGTRLSEAESETDGGTWDEWGGTKSPSQETDIVYQLGASSAAISVKVSSGTGGIDFDSAGTVDYTSGPKAVLSLVSVTTYGGIDTTVHKGTAYQVGSSGSDYYDYYIFGSKKEYPPAGGWVFLAIDPNEPAYRAAQVGTPVLSVVDYYGWWADIISGAKAENVIHDTISHLTYGEGLTLTRGDSTDPDGVFADFIDYDEGTPANRWGVVRSEQDALIVAGWLNIGDSAGVNATVFNDDGKSIFFPETLTAEGFQGIKIYMNNASDSFYATKCNFVGLGRGFVKDFFHTQDDVDATNDVISLDAEKDWRDLDYVAYSNEGGSDNIGLTSGNSYWIAWDSTNSGWAFYASRDNAATDTSRISLSDGSGGENHSFLKDPDCRPEFVVSGTTGLGMEIDTCNMQNFRQITLTSVATIMNAFIECKLLVQGGGELVNVQIVTLSETSEAFLQDPTFGTTSGLHDCTFIQGGSGHAIELDTATTYTLTNLFFSGYGANFTDSAAIDVTASSGTVTISIDGGDSPTYKTAGATVVIQNTVPMKITVTNQEGDLLEGINVRYEESDGTEIATGTTNASGIFSFDEDVLNLPYSGAIVIARHKAFEDFETTLDVPVSGFDIPVSLQPDLDVNLP